MGLCGAGAMEQMLENAGGESRVSGFPPRLAGLLRADAYPHPVSEVRLLQTHMSWVLLAGDYAYKIKRPVFYPFVDFRDPAARAHFCHEELRLNRRFAPELYLSVEPVCERDGSAVMGGAGVPLEHAVRMRRFDGSQELDQLVLAGAVDPGELRAFGAALAMRHEQLEVDARTAACEVVSRTGEVLQTNLRELRSVAASAALELGLDAVGSALDRVLLEAIGSLSTRALGSRIRECHGDLHLSNIVRIGGVLVPFDCLEFDPRLRWIDVADEVAFLYADLWAYGREDRAGARQGAFAAFPRRRGTRARPLAAAQRRLCGGGLGGAAASARTPRADERSLRFRQELARDACRRGRGRPAGPLGRGTQEAGGARGPGGFGLAARGWDLYAASHGPDLWSPAALRRGCRGRRARRDCRCHFPAARTAGTVCASRP